MGKLLCHEHKKPRFHTTLAWEKFGFLDLNGSFSILHKKRDIAVSTASKNDMRGILLILRAQCKRPIEDSNIMVGRSCHDILDKIDQHISRPQSVHWLLLLSESLVAAHGHQFELTSSAELMVTIVVDTFHSLFHKLRGRPLTEELVATLAFLTCGHEYKGTSPWLYSLANVDVSKSLINSDMLDMLFCVCLKELLHTFVGLVNAYCVMYDRELMKKVAESVLVCLQVYNDGDLLDKFQSYNW